MTRPFTVTFARGFGTGGKAIASRLAKELGIHCYENRILTLASQLSGLDHELFVEVDEKIRAHSGFSAFLAGLPRSRKYISREEPFAGDQQLFEYQKEIIENLNETESCCIVGKCANDILRHRDNVLSVYIEAPRDYCIRRTMDNMPVSREVAESTIEKTDRYRAEYYSFYTGGKSWTDPVAYDLTINSARIGIEGSVQLILAALKIRGFIE